MSEQNTSWSVGGIDTFTKRVFDLVKRLNVPWDLVAMIAKRYPYGQKCTTNYEQDEAVIYIVNRITEEGKHFNMSKKPNKIAENYIEKWLLDCTGDLTKEEVRVIKAYWDDLAKKLRI